ncbi:MAG: hypothetical protein ACI9XO_003649 [Paraglaciecola sp.]|jgi:hypothetical protein
MKDEKSDIQKHLEEKFKAMLPKEDAPEELKKEVFQTLDTLNLIGDVADLFTTKFTRTEVTFFRLMEEDYDEIINDENDDV